MSVQTIIKKIWYPDNDSPFPRAVRLLLSPPALFYRSLMCLRNGLYDRGLLPAHRLPCPVISVGNMTVGGTGKTPTVIMIAGRLAETGWKPAILSRGYGGASRSPVNVVSDGVTVLMRPEEAGDEPVLMALKLPGVPVLTGPERSLTGEAAIEKFGSDVLVLDDAFQHRQLKRDLDILLMDGRHPFGNGSTLPAGPLRESTSAMKRADMFVITGMRGSGYPERGMIPEKARVFHGRHRPLDLLPGDRAERPVSLDKISGKRICAFAGIGSPDTFRNTLEALGGDITSFLAFPDHHRYTEKDIYDIAEAARRGPADLIITTEKDGVKLSTFPEWQRQVFLLRITMEISSGVDDFTASLLAGLDSWKRQRQRP